MTPRSAVATAALQAAEPCVFSRMIAALCNQLPAGRAMFRPVTPEEVHSLLIRGRTCFRFFRGRYVGAVVVGETLDLSECTRAHGPRILDDAHAAAFGRPNIRI